MQSEPMKRLQRELSDWRYLLLFAAILAGSFVRFNVALELPPNLRVWSDPARHWENATVPITHNPLNGIDPLMYQVWLMVVLKVTNGHAMGIYAGILSAGTPWLWYRFLRELLPGKVLALTGYALFCWLPSWIGIFCYFMTETLVLPLLGLSLWFTWRCLRKATLESFVSVTILWLATVSTKQSLVPVAVIAMAWLWVNQAGKARRAVI